MNIYLYKGKGKDFSSEELIVKALEAYNEEYNLGMTAKEIKGVELCRTGKGKPYFKNIDLEFSVSHSGNAWVCAMGSCMVGIDIQLARGAKTIEVAKRFFTKEEADFVSDNDSNAFFRIWSGKESFVKFIGEGISYGFDKFSIIKGGDFSDTLENPVKCHFERVDLLADYECCICTGEKEKIWIREL